MDKLIQSFKYRPEIDGLRAIAVLAVVLYHAGLGVGGGFVGVDVFFVISGYLITSLIIKDLEAGRFSMLAFWERRARRIIPAAVVLVVIVLIAGWFLLLPTDYAKLGVSSLAHAVFAANFYFWQTTSYFAGPAEEVPLLHTWSLAVEEQFYFFIPVLLMLLFRFRLQKRQMLILTFATLFAGSLIFSMWAVPRMPAAAFYLLPTRGWELALGSLAALVPVCFVSALRPILRSILSWSGVFLTLFPCIFYSSATPFPGLAALPPCLGAMLFIVFSNGGLYGSPPLLNRIFSSKPMVAVGLVSYSLYLWHWPLFAFYNYWSFGEIPIIHRIVLVGLSGVLAYFSWRFVETPFRLKKVGATRRGIYVASFLGLALTVIVGALLTGWQGVPTRFDPAVVEMDRVRVYEKKHYPVPMMSIDRANRGDIPVFEECENPAVKILVWGDSHTRAILPAVRKAFSDVDVLIQAAWYPSTPPLLDYVPEARFALGDDASSYNQSIMDYLKARDFDHVILAGKWSEHLPIHGSGSERELAVIDSLEKTISSVVSAGAQAWVLLQIPRHKANVPKVLMAQQLFGADIEPFKLTTEDYEPLNAQLLQFQQQIDEAGGQIIDASSWLLEADGSYAMGRKQKAFYFDNNHLSITGAESVSAAFEPLRHD